MRQLQRGRGHLPIRQVSPHRVCDTETPLLLWLFGGKRDSACLHCCWSHIGRILAGVTIAGTQRQGDGAQEQQEAAEAEEDQLAALVREAAAASESPAVLALVPPELRSIYPTDVRMQ
jgi:hypothetical protein